MKADLKKFANDTVDRFTNGRKMFVECVVEVGCGKFSEAEAEAIFTVYRKLKVIKYDAGVGRFNVVHGAYWSVDALTNALTLSKAGK